MNELLSRKITELSEKLSDLRGFLNVPLLETKIKDLDEKMAAPDFWNDQDKANKLIREAKALKGNIDPLKEAEKRAAEAHELLEISEGDAEMEAQIEVEVSMLVPIVAKLE